MRESRIWNEARSAIREKNRETWTKNLSESCQGRVPWNKGVKGSQVPWNKNLPAEQQPMFGKKKPAEWIEKYKKTNLKRYGTENPGILAKRFPRSKKEKLLEDKLKGYQFNIKVGKYRPDYVNEETKHIIEVYGDYWHCNPKLFDADFYHSQLKKTASEKWKLDEKRKQFLESLGYIVTIVWASDLDDFIKTLK